MDLLLGVQLHYQGQGTEELDFVVPVGEETPGQLPSFSGLLEPVQHILDFRNRSGRGWFIQGPDQLDTEMSAWLDASAFWSTHIFHLCQT